MKIFSSLAILLGLFCFSCGTGNNSKQTKLTNSDTGTFYPVADFFRQQIEYVDLRDFPIYRIRVIDGRKDSTAFSKEELISLAGSFKQKLFAEPGGKGAYEENVFEDLSTHSYTLSYTTTDPSLELRSIDVLLSPETREAKRVFIKRMYSNGDTIIDEQLSWKADKSLQLIRKKQTTNGYHSAETNYINWNDAR